MHLLILLFGTLLYASQAYGSQQIQMPEAGAFVSDDDLLEQLDRLKQNVSELWANFGELKTVLTQTLDHIRVHQVELEETVHMLEHKHDDSGSSHGTYTDDHHHHSGEQHSHGDDHSHGGDHSHGDDHSHDGDHSHVDSHSHDGDHSHGDDHSHGGDHSHGDDHSHSHSGDQHSHGDDHHHSWSHSHSSSARGDSSHSSHDADSHHHHGAHETVDDVQQSQQGADAMLEPLVKPTTVRQHYHPHLSMATNSLQLVSDPSFNRHHHHHPHTHGKSERNRTVVLPKYSEYMLYDFAVCNVQPNRVIPTESQQPIMGRVNLWQKKSGGPLNIHVRLQGFDMGGDHHHHDVQQSLQKEEDNETPTTVGHKHGFHIHASGDLSNGCNSAGPHYNPHGVTHAGPSALTRHVGDLGNIECDDKGNVNIVFNDEIASLKGPYSIIGRAIVIHATADDLGLGGDDESLRTGNAGARLACCVIETVDKLPVRSYKFIKAATPYQNR